jgi:hypothetical protein
MRPAYPAGQGARLAQDLASSRQGTLLSSTPHRNSGVPLRESPSDKSSTYIALRRGTVSPRVTEKIRKNARGAALPVSAGEPQAVRSRIVRGWRPGFGYASACFLPLIAAGSASRRAGQGPGESPAGVAGAVGVLDAVAWEQIMLGGGGREGPEGAGDDLAVQVGGLPVWQGDQPVIPDPGLGAASLTWVRGAWALPRRQDD